MLLHSPLTYNAARGLVLGRVPPVILFMGSFTGAPHVIVEDALQVLREVVLPSGKVLREVVLPSGQVQRNIVEASGQIPRNVEEPGGRTTRTVEEPAGRVDVGRSI